MKHLSDKITILAALIGCITGVLSLSWQVYTETKYSKEDLAITWGIYPTPIHRLLTKNEEQFNDGLRVTITNRSKVDSSVTSIRIASTMADCPFEYRLTEIDDPLPPILKWSFQTFIFNDSLPVCVDLYNDDIQMILKTTRGNVFRGDFNPIFGAFNKEGKFFSID